MRTTELRRSIAASVDAPTALWPVLAALFAGLDSLGSSPGMVVRLLRGAGVGRGDTVIDLACGKGAIAVAATERLSCRVVGVDGSPEFVESAQRLAGRRGVAGLARFVQGDVRELPRELSHRRFDAAMMIGLYGLIDAARVLRGLTVRGGVYIVDDCFHDPRRGRRGSRWRGVPTMEECNAGIEGLGDRVERVEVPAPGVVKRLHDRLYARLAANAARIARGNSRLRGPLREFLRRQRSAQRVLAGPVRPAVWVVRRG